MGGSTSRRTPGWLAVVVAVLASTLLVSACAGGGSDSDQGAAGGEAAVDAPPADLAEESDDEAADAGEADGAGAAARVDPAPRAIVHVVDLTVVTDDVTGAARRAAALAETSGGYVQNENTTGSGDGTDGPVRSTLSLRVPVGERVRIVDQIEALGEVRSRDRTAEDVTDQVTDVEARVATQRASIARLRVLLDDAADLRDVVTLGSELARREADLDSLLRRQAELSQLTQLATVTVTFVSPDDAAARAAEREIGATPADRPAPAPPG
jgi:hypothetical protein